MSTKGSWQRPKDDKAWGSNFDRIFGKCVKHIEMTEEDLERAVVSGFPAGVNSEPLEDSYQVYADPFLSGRSSTAEQGALTAPVVSSNLTAPATYINPDTGE